MPRKRRNTRADGIYEPNMTPLIDVSLVLVVILMVATPLAFQSSIAIRNAASSGRSAAENARAERIEVHLLAGGVVEVNRALIARQNFAATLGPLLAASGSRLVVVRCDDGVAHGDFVGVLDEARTLGARQIAVTGS